MRSNISDIISTPDKYSSIFPTCRQEHALVISDRNAIHWVLVLVECRDQATLWTELVYLIYSSAKRDFILQFARRVDLHLG